MKIWNKIQNYGRVGEFVNDKPSREFFSTHPANYCRASLIKKKMQLFRDTNSKHKLQTEEMYKIIKIHHNRMTSITKSPNDLDKDSNCQSSAIQRTTTSHLILQNAA